MNCNIIIFIKLVLTVASVEIKLCWLSIFTRQLIYLHLEDHTGIKLSALKHTLFPPGKVAGLQCYVSLV